MKNPGPKTELRILRRFILEAERKFLDPHMSAPALGVPSRDEELDVAAFVVLAHGAFENFVEGVGLWVLQTIERKWISERRASKCLASLLLYKVAGEQDMDEDNDISVFNNIRNSVQEAKAVRSQRIAQNNGIALRHLRSIFRPLGIDVPGDPQLTGSLELLVSLRHQWAHQYRYGAKVVKFASDVKKTSDDCLELAGRLVTGVGSARP